ncbi:protein translocase subunit SecF [Parvularcula sp. ZS-1/3]|uniref:Protein-export membrane protein SecF n=1 Tax=Parvularcula mediterranea TaxID=2732508 RepID=A0A7Y3RJ27_9PROT|nr:protein translocase subunit SecF [Parvularcula mediterranea]NNU14998.1 protein translocase subunit SecF [Parvularcula mediterranea]
MAFQLVPSNTKIDFVQFRGIAQIFSTLAIVGSIAAFFTLGLNFGIDFRGGVTVEVGPAPGQVFTEQSLTDAREATGQLGLGDVQVQTIGGTAGAEDGIVVSVEAISEEDGGQERQAAVAGEVQEVLRQALGAEIEMRRVDSVTPTVSGELVQAGVTALVVAIGLMLVYIWFRFEWQFSIGAILALTHDVILTIGVFCITQFEFSLAIIAALLTIIGYSMNDTVVIYDRIRENLRKFKAMDLKDVVNLSVNQTLGRTIMTSLTTLLAVVSLFLFGGEVLRGFSFALIWGVIVGTYSTVYIASPLLLMTGVKRDWTPGGSAANAEADARP